jgi:hypothetical protein
VAVTYLVATAVVRGTADARSGTPRLPRDFRRFNLPVQLALAAAADVVSDVEDPANLAVVSLAPCHNGSPELYRWAEAAIAAGMGAGFGASRMNPTHTLHVVDNLALSAFAIAYQSDGYSLGLGGAPGQAWSAVEAICDRLADGWEHEGMIMAGDQARAAEGSQASGVALLFSARPKPYGRLGKQFELLGIERRPWPAPVETSSHAAEGLCAFIAALARPDLPAGRFTYVPPPEHTDGADHVTVVLEIG